MNGGVAPGTEPHSLENLEVFGFRKKCRDLPSEGSEIKAGLRMESSRRVFRDPPILRLAETWDPRQTEYKETIRAGLPALMA